MSGFDVVVVAGTYAVSSFGLVGSDRTWFSVGHDKVHILKVLLFAWAACRLRSVLGSLSFGEGVV